MKKSSNIIPIVALVGASAYLIYEGLKKFVLKGDELSSDKLDSSDLKLQQTPYEILQSQVQEAYVRREAKKVGKDIITSIEYDVDDSDDNIEGIKGKKIKGGIIYKNYFLRPSSDKKGRLVVGKLGDKKRVYKIFGTIYYPFKVKKAYAGNIQLKDIDFKESKEDPNVIQYLKLIDNKDKSYYIDKDDLDMIIDNFKSNVPKYNLKTDKADFVLSRI
jgi:hypothetical protein